MISPSRASSLSLPVVFILILFFIVTNVVRYFTEDDEYDDEDSITVTFNCTQVLGNQNNYQDFVVQQCKQLRANE